MKIRNKWSGFTIIELMVVISIIGILSAIIYASFDGAREDARNKAFAVQMKEVQLAIELYKAQEGRYPEPELDSSNPNACKSTGGANETANDSLDTCLVPIIVGMVPDFIAQIPHRSDSSNSNCILNYEVEDDGLYYKLTGFNCVSDGTVAPDDELARCPDISACSSESYCQDSDPNFSSSVAVYSAGGECL